MDLGRSLLGAVIWIVVFAGLVRRVPRLHRPTRAAVAGSVLLLLLTAAGQWSGNYDLREMFTAEGPILTRVAGGALVAFLFYEWRDRARG